MAKKYAYARWVNDKVAKVTKENQQEVRGRYFSNSGKIAHYDEYARWCRLYGYDFDDSPDGYWESKARSWNKPMGYVMGASGILAWFIASVVAASTGQRRE